ncbi:MAG: N-formylglutamate amidohydrolase [Pseudomonadota bacterium]
MTEDSAFFVIGENRSGSWVVTVDHARNRIPDWIGDLGLDPADLDRHIAFDPGAEGVALALGEILDAPVVASNFSRLVIDPNRGADDPTLVMQLYDGTLIPGNRHLTETDRTDRHDRLYAPYHVAVAAALAARADPVLLAIHSFTPQLNGRPPRPWDIGVLFADDDRLSMALVRSLQSDPSLTVGVNEPYVGHLPGDSVDTHALRQGRHNTLIELRNDLIDTAAKQQAWAARLAPHLTKALSQVATA